MGTSAEKSLLLKNVDALMRRHWGKVNKTRLANESKVGQGTYDRIADGTSIGLEVLGKVAATFRLKAWQLIATELDPDSPPKLSSLWPCEHFSPEQYRKFLTPEERKENEALLWGKIMMAEKKNGTDGP